MSKGYYVRRSVSRIAKKPLLRTCLWGINTRRGQEVLGPNMHAKAGLCSASGGMTRWRNAWSGLCSTMEAWHVDKIKQKNTYILNNILLEKDEENIKECGNQEGIKENWQSQHVGVASMLGIFSMHWFSYNISIEGLLSQYLGYILYMHLFIYLF